MQMVEGFDFFPLTFDDRGKLKTAQQLSSLIAHANSADASDAIFLAHGFRNDESEATNLYNKFLKTFRAQLSRAELAGVAARRFVVAGVYWPSKPFREVFADETTGTRGLRNPAEAMADVTARLEAMKRDATPAQRAKLEKAGRLLPKLAGSAKAQD